ncbi:MAG: hypothetical protein KBD78_10895 [Oligoflexales bacterium]|nr:hypothetical protein [Oligoflexales bacterium]
MFSPVRFIVPSFVVLPLLFSCAKDSDDPVAAAAPVYPTGVAPEEG